MIKTIKLKIEDKPTTTQLKRIEKAAYIPIINDIDSPIYSIEQLGYLDSESKKLNK